MLKMFTVQKLTKKIYTLLIICCFFLEGFGQTQTPWTAIWGGNGEDFTFEEIQESFNTYWLNRDYEKGKGYKQYKRWEAYMTPRIYPSADMTLPSTNYQNFINWQRTQNTGSRTGISNWTPLGPFVKATGDDTGVGRLNMLRFDPTNSSIMYVGAPDGGLWKSTNSGASWTTNTDFLGVIGVSDLAIDPTDTDIMYLATGDIEGDRRSIGVLKSTNGGTTWNTTGLTWTAIDNYKISKLLMHPANPLILLAATDGGVFRTIDGGDNWTSPSTIEDFKDMEFKPGDPNTVYAAGKEIWKSIDNGVSWIKITSGLPSTNIVRIALGVTTAADTYVYALIGRADNNGLLGLYRSTDSGDNFAIINQNSPAKNVLGYNSDGLDIGGQAFYDLAIAVSPTDENFVIVGGVNQWKSANGGVDWTISSYWNPDPNFAFVHADIHEITYQGTTIYACHDGGLAKSTDAGTTWTDISNNLNISQQNAIGISAITATRYVAGLQDIGTISHTTSWSVVGGGDGEDAFIDRTDDNYIIITGTNGSHQLSTDGGTTFNSIVNAPLLEGDANANFYSPIRQDPVTSTRYYAAGRNHLYASQNEGTSWTKLGSPFGTTDEADRIIEFSIAPNTPAIIYAIKGTAIAKSVDSGNMWTDITGSLPVGSAKLSNLTVSNTDPNKVWVTFSGYSAANKVYKTTNGGGAWTNLSTGLPNLPANTIVFHNNSANEDIYMGMDIGVYHIDNTTSTWQSFFTDLPRVRVKDLRISYLGVGKLRAATYGRGAWESALAAPLPVELTTFYGENKDKENLLFWTTETETNLDYYVIERSINGHNFETIGTIEVENPNSIISKNYTFTDTKPAKGVNYYRLKIIDTDGSFEYSKAVILYLDDVESKLSIYPNPSVDFIEIKGITENTVIRFMDVLGRPIRTEEVTPTTKINVSAFPNGIYFIEIMTSDKTSTIQRFIKE